MQLVEPIEVVWCFVSAVGLCFSAFSYYYAVMDLRYLRKHGYNGLRRILARVSRRKEFLRVFSQTMFLVAGILSLFRPKPSAQGPSRTWIVMIFISIVTMMMYGSIMDWYDRKRVIDTEE